MKYNFQHLLVKDLLKKKKSKIHKFLETSNIIHYFVKNVFEDLQSFTFLVDGIVGKGTFNLRFKYTQSAQTILTTSHHCLKTPQHVSNIY